MKKIFTILLVLVSIKTLAQPIDPSYFNALQWRCIGPHRGGRTVGAQGLLSKPNVFFIGVNNGGVWRTDDYGRTWTPIFDSAPTGSVGDIAISESNPDIIYVGSGEGLQRPDLSVGDGIYKTTNGGKTWINTGLKDAQQIGGMALDPVNPDRLFVAALGHPYGPNNERGIYRTLDGGQTWKQVLYLDENTGAIQVTLDPSNSNTVYASLWAGRQGPWENGAWNGKGSGFYKSTDGGNTWRKMNQGFPTIEQGLGRIGFCISPSDPRRLYATVDASQNGGIYRSDDGGESWYLLTKDNRYYGRASDFAELKVDPKNADIVYSANVVTWKSADGGKTWNAFRGAPGGDDYHRIWINPNNPDIILLASDQGAIITVNGGRTFSSWYNQPTAQFYHVSTDNAFPYNVYGGQQESGSVGIVSRGNDGQVSYREWHPVGVEEYGYVAADPLNPNIIYGGKITRFDKTTGQVQNIAPEPVRGGQYRFLRTAPVLFSPVDKKTLYYAGNVLFKTLDGGQHWKVISPDLSREKWDIPPSVGVYTDESQLKMPRRGVIYTIAPSFKDINTIWVGTDDGLIHLTRNGGASWKNITPPAITAWSKISLMEAGHFDNNTVYAAVNRIRCDDMKPHIYRTHDGGNSWKEIVNGLPDDPINAVREDPFVKGLLYAGSERAVYFSADDGEHWQSLRLNMPGTSIRDLVIKDDDIVVGTHGRSFWILDDITPLRQLAALKNLNQPRLFTPQLATRVRWNTYTDTPVPQEEPAGENPPDGAIINYYLPAAAANVELVITDQAGRAIRRFSDKDSLYKLPALNIPTYWIRPQQILSSSAGSHRFVWDLKYTPLNVPAQYPISAVFQNTPPVASSPWVLPGKYTVSLVVDGKSYSAPLTIRMDPRVKEGLPALQAQHDLSVKVYQARMECMSLSAEIARVHQSKKLSAEIEKELAALENGASGINRLNSTFAGLHSTLQEADRMPTSQVIEAVNKAIRNLADWKSRWNTLGKGLGQ